MNIYASSFVTHTKALGTMGPFKHTSDRVSFVSVCFSVCFFFLSFRLFFYTCWLLFTLLCFRTIKCNALQHQFAFRVVHNSGLLQRRLNDLTGVFGRLAEFGPQFFGRLQLRNEKNQTHFFQLFFFLTTSIYNGIKVAAVSTVSYLPADSQWGRNRLNFYFIWSGDDGMDGWSMDWQKWTK